MKACLVEYVLVPLGGLVILALPLLGPLLIVAAICLLVACPHLTLVLILIARLLR